MIALALDGGLASLSPPYSNAINSRRDGVGHVLVVEVLDRRKRGERLGRERDRLAVAVRQCRCGARRRFARQRVKGRADAAAQLDQVALAAASGNGKRERIEVA